jgi:hypothetical protein
MSRSNCGTSLPIDVVGVSANRGPEQSNAMPQMRMMDLHDNRKERRRIEAFTSQGF